MKRLFSLLLAAAAVFSLLSLPVEAKAVAADGSQNLRSFAPGAAYAVKKVLHRHHYTVKVVAPTCTEGGYTLKTCPCGHTVKTKAKAPLGHSFGPWIVTRKATETQPGHMKKVCETCGYEEERILYAHAHKHKFHVTVVPPTCETRGYTSYVCDCGEHYEKKFTKPTGHKYGPWEVIKKASDTETGRKCRTCLTCGKVQTDFIQKDAHVHSYTAQVIAPTCQEKGYTLHTCACGHSYKSDYVNPVAHKYGAWTVKIPSTPTKKGVKTRSCIYCSKTQRKSIPKAPHSHNYVDTVIAPSCTEQGYTLHTCACGHSYQDHYTDPLGHTFGDWDTRKSGKKWVDIRTCEACGASERRSHSHVYHPVVIPPNCTDQGYTLHFCACGRNYKTDYIDPTGHEMSDWTVVKSPTETAPGIRKRTCQLCDYEETEEIPRLGHTHSYQESGREILSSASYIQNVRITYSCSCGHSYDETKSVVNDTFVKNAGATLIAKTNRLRKPKHLTPLTGGNDHWQKWADMRARELDDLFSHTRPDGSDCWSEMGNDMIIAENVAYNWVQNDLNPETFFYQYKNSPSHLANLLNSDAHEVYIGTYVDLKSGKVYNSMIFVHDRAKASATLSASRGNSSMAEITHCPRVEVIETNASSIRRTPD